MELYYHSPNTSSCGGASLSNEYVFIAWYFVKHRNNFTIYTLESPKLRSFLVIEYLEEQRRYRSLERLLSFLTVNSLDQSFWTNIRVIF